MSIHLKHPVASYSPRLKQFLINLRRVRNIPPHNTHLWKVMDIPAFEDTETALETVLTSQPAQRRAS